MTQGCGRNDGEDVRFGMAESAGIQNLVERGLADLDRWRSQSGRRSRRMKRWPWRRKKPRRSSRKSCAGWRTITPSAIRLCRSDVEAAGARDRQRRLFSDPADQPEQSRARRRPRNGRADGTQSRRRSRGHVRIRPRSTSVISPPAARSPISKRSGSLASLHPDKGIV